MAAPSYATDLTTLALGSITVDAGTWDESTDAAWDDAGSMVDDGNLQYNGLKCVSAQFTKDGVGTILYEHTSSITVPTDGAVLIHHLWAAPRALATLANGGVRPIVGNGLGVFKAWKGSGSDQAPAPSGGWYQYAIDPSLVADYTVGSPATPYNTFGIAVSATAQARGNPQACNAVRYGRCEVIYTDGDAATPATFDGWATIDNAEDNKYGLSKYVEGGLKQQGLHSFGTASTPVYFEDANKKIVIEDTKNTTANFNRYEVVNAASVLKWTAISFQALGTNSKGQFIAIDNATIEMTDCIFEDDDYFTYKSNSLIVGTIHRRCGLVTQGGATMTSGTIDTPFGSVGMLVDNLNLVSKYNFNSDGTGHGVDLGTISSDQSLIWDNTDSGYTASSSGNETILVNIASGFTLTINVSDTATTPSVYNTGAGTVTVVSGQKSFALTLNPSITGYEWRLYSVTATGSLAGASELAGEETATADNQTYNYTYTSDIIIAVQIISDDYKESTTFYTLLNSDQSVGINLTLEDNV